MLEALDLSNFLIVQMVLASVLGLSLYLPFSAGQLSLASPGFYALGGYVAGILSTKTFDVEGTYPLPLVFVELVVAGVLCGVLALVVGLAALRLSGIYLALATIAFVEVLRILAQTLSLTGKSIGIFSIPQPFATDLGYLWLAIPLLLLAGGLAWRLEQIRAGRAFAAVREDELAAASVGIDTTRAKVIAFGFGGVFAGMAGVVSAHLINAWSPSESSFDASIAYLSFVLIGGSRTFLGPIVGGMALTWLPEWLRARGTETDFLPNWISEFLVDGRLIVYGVLLAASCVFFPRGIVTPEVLDWLRRPFAALRKRIPFRRDPSMDPERENLGVKP